MLHEVLYTQPLTGHFGQMNHVDLLHLFTSVYAVWSCKHLNFQYGFLLILAQFFFLLPFFLPKAFYSLHRVVSLLMQNTFCAQERFLSAPPQCIQRCRTLLECQQVVGHTGKQFCHQKSNFLHVVPFLSLLHPFLFPEISDSAYQFPQFSPFIFKINHLFIFLLPFQQ